MNILPKRNWSKDDYKMVFVGKRPVKEQSPWCEHAIDINSIPRTNCKQCFTFVMVRNAEFVKAAFTDLGAGKENLLVNEFGSKFVKNLKWLVERTKVMSQAAEMIEERMEEDVLANPDADVTVDHDGLDQKPIAALMDSYLDANPLEEYRRAEVEVVA